MEKEELKFPPISGRSDLPANIYIDTLSLDEIHKRKSLGYKLVVPVARYVDEDHLSIGVEGFFLARFMEYVSESTNILLRYPIWIKEGDHALLHSNLHILEEFGFKLLLFEERSSLVLPSHYDVFILEDVFNKIDKREYEKFSMLFYLALVPEMTHIEKMKGVKTEKIDFSLYNEALDLLKKLISEVTNLLE